jgi:hypothetical protein
MTIYVIDNEDRLPFGILNNNFNYDLCINKTTYRNCSHYIYSNCILYILSHNTILSHQEEKYLSLINKSPTFETYQEVVEMINNDIKYKILYTNILSQLTTPTFDDYLLKCDINHLSLTLKNVILSVRSNLTIKKHYNYYPSYLVIKIINEYLNNELEEFSVIQQFLYKIENKKSDSILQDIILSYGFAKLQMLPIYDFEYEVENDKELLKVLELSQSYPNILFIFSFKYHLRNFKNRMEFRYRNKILELFLKYKNKYTESIKKEIYLVHNRKLKDIIIEQVLNYDDNFKKFIDKDIQLRQITSSLISDDKLYDYESFNFFDIEACESKMIDKLISRENSNKNNSFSSYLASLDTSENDYNIFPDNLEKVKMVLATMSIHKKFQIPLPKNQIDNYDTHLPAILKPHIVSFNNDLQRDDRLSLDIQSMLYYSKGVSLFHPTEDLTLQNFVGALITNLAMVSSFRPYDCAVYKEKTTINNILQDDLFMNMWLKRQLQYISNFISCTTLFLEINSVSVNPKTLNTVLSLFMDSSLFLKTNKTFSDVPIFFSDILEYYFNTELYDENDKKTLILMIWNLITYNIEIILKTRDLVKAKFCILKNILRLRYFPECVENKENNDIACYTFAIINVGNKLKKLMDIYNISLKSGNIEKYVEAIILNTKQPVYDEDYLPTSKEEAEDNKDIKKIVNEIFTQNENVIQSYLSQDSIVKLINNSLKNEEEKYKINCWVVISF